MKNITKEIIDSKLDGVYDALRSGYHIVIKLPNDYEVDIETTEGIRGINYPVKVKINNGELYIIK
jgi:hypothetical protein